MNKISWLLMKMSSNSWKTTLKCSPSNAEIDPFNDSFMQSLQWIRFIFLSPCPQRLLFSSINFLFLLILILFVAQRIISKFLSRNNPNSSINKPLLGTNNSNNEPRAKVTFWFILSCIAVGVLAVLFVVLSVLGLLGGRGSKTSWKTIEAVFRIAEAVTQIAVLAIVVHEKKFRAVNHPVSLRVYWVAHFVLVSLFSISAITRFISIHEGLDELVRTDDLFSLVSLPFSMFLGVIAFRGSSGIVVSTESDDGTDERTRLINRHEGIDLNTTEYAKANAISSLTWRWMNPVLDKGYKNPLKIEDIPSLPSDYQAERMAELFMSNWPKPGESMKHPVGMALLKCFWQPLVYTGFLAFIRLVVMYVGPVLIKSFVKFTAGEGSSPNEGYYLVLTLLLAKMIEVFSSHHFNFQTQKAGLLIRSTLITALYRKGLKLSCSSRQAHGVGKIVNYMAVDAQQLGDLINQLHNLWLMPLQILGAFALLYVYMGLSTLGALLGVCLLLVYVMFRGKGINTFQFQIMRNRDSRMKAMNEMINNMRVIKFQAWETFFEERIQSFRTVEFKWLTKFAYAFAENMGVLFSLPLILAILVFGFAIWMGMYLDPSIVFTATTVLKLLQAPIQGFPQSLIQISMATISLGRLDGYLMSPELDDTSVERDEGCQGDVAIEVKDGTFSWDDDDAHTTLKGLNLEIKKGQLAAIVGTVGSGKSSLLAAILGEMHKISGKVRVCGTTAYVAQTSWIQNATIEDNILFGKPMNRQKYKDTIRVCSLEKDLEIMEFGDQTEIGERGINLSGGQKQRIQLARAIYQDCDVYLLDDVFSAVDAHTGSEIFKECVRGVLKDKTVLLVTHQVDFLHNADLIMVMREGSIVQSGRYNELLQAGLDFGSLVAAYESSMELVDMSSQTLTDNPVQTPISPAADKSLQRVLSTKKSLEKTNSQKATAKLIEDEERETGQVHSDVYKEYCTKAFGWWGVVFVMVISLIWIASTTSTDYWLAYQTAETRTFTPGIFMAGYALIGLVSCLVVASRAVIVTLMGLKTAQSYFSQFLNSILHAPMSFYDTTPSGRILNRASADQTAVDFMIPFFMGMIISIYFAVVAIIAVTCVNAWPTVFLIIPLIWVNLWYRAYYIANSRELTRLSSITKSPIIHHFSETVSGVVTVRCFRRQALFTKENIDKVDVNVKMDFYTFGATEWLGFRLEIIGSLVFCISTFFLIVLPSSFVKPEYVGLSLSYGMSLNAMLFMTIFMTCTIENKMVSVERLKQLINIPSEAAWVIKDCLPPTWPTHGNIVLKDVQVRYRPNTPLVLKGLTLDIKGGEKIGVVGRTGSGKSTLIQVLFRLVEPCGGKIVIDGVDITKIGLHDLRSRFGIIPQEPVLFQGTVRSNVDPLGLYSDEDIWKALDRCQLKAVVAATQEKLDAPVEDGGENWSVGQRQLMCLGRVMLKKSRILFMDEATASVDSQTDSTIQKIIRDDFRDCTIITVAHRIPTVMDCDKVLVVDAGWLKEYDSPSRLLERPSLFGALVQEYSDRSAEE